MPKRVLKCWHYQLFFIRKWKENTLVISALLNEKEEFNNVTKKKEREREKQGDNDAADERLNVYVFL